MIAFDKALVYHRVLMRFGLSSIVFAWLFVFANEALVLGSLSGALVQTALLYTLAQTICALVAPIAMREIGSGMRRGIVLGTLVAGIALVVLAGTSVGMFIDLATNMTIFAVFMGIYAALYKIPYATSASLSQMHTSNMILDILLAFMPVLWVSVGMFDVGNPFVIIFGGATALVVASIVPLLFARGDVYERFSWGYRDTYAQLFARDNRALVRRSIVQGVESAALLFVWPLALFLFLGWNYVAVGVVLSASLFIAILVRYLLRKIRGESQLIRNTVVASGWLARMIAVSPVGFVVADVYARSAVSHDQYTYLADAGHYVDEYTALKEISSAIGRIAIAIFAAILFASVSYDIAFVVLFAVVGLIATGTTFGSKKYSRQLL